MVAPLKTRKQPYTDEEAALLQNPRLTLPAHGTLVDQETGKEIRFDPDKIAPALQNFILDFVADPPRQPSGHRKMALVVASRQTGKTTTAALAAANRISYSPGQYGVTMADTRERAETLFNAVLTNHDHLPDRIRPPTIPNRESRQITFLRRNRYRTLSAEMGNVGIGRAIDAGHFSELPFWGDLATVWNKIFPAMVNRKELILLAESTPAPLSEPSAEAFRDLVSSARQGFGRWVFHFSAFFESRLNERPWQRGWTLTREELRLLEKFGPKGNQPVSNPGNVTYLTLENLAFRREILANDALVRRFPELFFVFYPTDPVSCWGVAGGGIIPRHALERHRNKVLIPWMPGERYMVYRDPRPGAVYVIGVDPAGYGSDHASFQVLEVWHDAVIQCAEYACPNVDPLTFAEDIKQAAVHFNDATVVVERNGVGLATIAQLQGYVKRGEMSNLFYEKIGALSKPGIHAHKQSIEEGLGMLIDGLMTNMVLFGAETVDQLSSYRQDKLVVDSASKAILEPGKIGKGRRHKHHWDRVSALMWAVWATQHVVARIRPSWVDVTAGSYAGPVHSDDPEMDDEAAAEAMNQMTARQVRDYRRVLARDERRRERRGRRNTAYKKKRGKAGK